MDMVAVSVTGAVAQPCIPDAVQELRMVYKVWRVTSCLPDCTCLATHQAR